MPAKSTSRLILGFKVYYYFSHLPITLLVHLLHQASSFNLPVNKAFGTQLTPYSFGKHKISKKTINDALNLVFFFFFPLLKLYCSWSYTSPTIDLMIKSLSFSLLSVPLHLPSGFDRFNHILCTNCMISNPTSFEVFPNFASPLVIVELGPVGLGDCRI